MTNNAKTYGANIRCVICGKEPFAADPALECHELLRLNAGGEISESPSPGEWFCPEHAPPKQPATRRAVRGTPLEAVDELERLFDDEVSRLVEALPGDDDDNRDDVEAAFEGFRREIARGLAQLKEVIARYVKPPASGAPKPRRAKAKQISAGVRGLPGQTSLLEEEPTTS